MTRCRRLCQLTQISQATLFVHDYSGSVYNGANPVTVTVYILGNPVFAQTRSMSGEDTATYFCKIAWPCGVVTGF
jgi:hypothetical protein